MCNDIKREEWVWERKRGKKKKRNECKSIKSCSAITVSPLSQVYISSFAV
jgi:hypothetical protein